MFFMKLLGRFSFSLYLRTQKTGDLTAAYILAERGLASEILDKASWLKLLKTKNRIDEELYRRDPNWCDFN